MTAKCCQAFATPFQRHPRQAKAKTRQLERVAGVFFRGGCGSGLEPTNRHSDVTSLEKRMKPLTDCTRPGRLLGVMLILAAAASLAGCGVVAAPVRITSAVVKVVPVAGDVVAAPLDVTADTID